MREARSGPIQMMGEPAGLLDPDEARILLVEDDDDIAEQIVREFNDRGYVIVH